MWIKIVYVPHDKESIIVPEFFSKELYSTCTVNFGRKSFRIKTIFSYNLEFNSNSTFDNPMIIKLSYHLKDKLLIPESQIYRMKIKDNNIIIGPVIGFMLGVRNHSYSTKYMKKYTNRFGIYKKVGGLIFAFSPTSVDWKKEIAYGMYYNISRSKWEYGAFPIPSVIYRRKYHQPSEVINKLSLVTGGRLFNSYRFTKLELFDHVKHDMELASILPPTEASQSYEQLKSFIDTYTKVILKPINLSRGRGICVIEKIDSIYKIFDYRLKNSTEIILDGNNSLEEFFSNNKSFFNEYLVQKYLKLAKIDNRLFDIRVVMQKEDVRGWICTGIECRVSRPNSHITNISRGGYALPLDEALTFAFHADPDTKQELTKQIYEYCYKFCNYMDKTGKHFAEFGLDIALDEDKKIWLIEANVLPSFKGFKKMDYNNYLALRYSPLLYALSLSEFDDSNGG